MKQLTFSATGFERYGKTTRRAAFLSEMERVVPWADMCGLIAPFYPKPGNGRPPYGLERMLRIYFLQQWFNLSDPGVEEALYNSAVMRDFAGIDLGREAAPDETHDLPVPAFARGARPWPPSVRGSASAFFEPKRVEGLDQHDCRRHDHPCAVLDQNASDAQSRDASNHEATAVVFSDMTGDIDVDSNEEHPFDRGNDGERRRLPSSADLLRRGDPRVGRSGLSRPRNVIVSMRRAQDFTKSPLQAEDVVNENDQAEPDGSESQSQGRACVLRRFGRVSVLPELAIAGSTNPRRLFVTCALANLYMARRYLLRARLT